MYLKFVLLFTAESVFLNVVVKNLIMNVSLYHINKRKKAVIREVHGTSFHKAVGSMVYSLQIPSHNLKVGFDYKVPFIYRVLKSLILT